jgi:hypothetical protein
MTTEEETDIRDSLMTTYKQMISLYNDKNRVESKNYRLLAILLRSLLLDKDYPMLLFYAKHIGVKLKIVSYARSLSSEIQDSCTLYMSYPATLPHWPAMIDGNIMDIEAFLETPLGIIPVESKAKGGEEYNARQVIKWISNKDGSAHFDLKKPEAYRSLKGFIFHRGSVDIEGFLMQNIIFSLTKWAMTAIVFVLSDYFLISQSRKYWKQKKDIPYIEYSRLNLIAHYKLIRQSLKKTIMDGEHSYFCDGIDQIIDNCLFITSFILIPETKQNGEKYIFEALISQEQLIKISIIIIDDDKVILRVGNDRNIIEKVVLEINNAIKFWEYFVMTIKIERKKSWYASAFINSELVFEVCAQNVLDDRDIRYNAHCIGANAEKQNGGIFNCNEIVIVNQKVQDDVYRYYENSLWYTTTSPIIGVPGR